MATKPGDLNIADMWEALSDIFAADPALMHRAIDGSGIDWTWADFERDASRLAGHLVSSGLGPDSKVAFYLHNGPEYLIGTFAAFKIRGVPVNVNYRYEQSELRYLLTNSDAEAVLCNADLLPRVHSLLDELSALRTVIVVDDLAQPAESIYYSHDRVNIVSWATALDAAPADRRTDRTGDDLWFLYTGGTTGMPKGVMWPHRSLLISWKGSFKVLGLELPSTIDELIEGMRTQPIEARQRILPAAPLMHGTSAMTAMSALCAGGSVVTLTNRSFDGDALGEKSKPAASPMPRSWGMRSPNRCSRHSMPRARRARARTSHRLRSSTRPGPCGRRRSRMPFSNGQTLCSPIWSVRPKASGLRRRSPNETATSEPPGFGSASSLR